MSRTDDTTSDSRGQNTKDRFRLLGMIRRVSIKLTSGSTWQAIGLLLLDQKTEETIPVEPFSNAGFYARPPAGANVEAIIASPGGDAEGAVIIASRDEDTRKKMAVLEQDETVAYNSKAKILIDKSGNIREIVPTGKIVEIKDVSGTSHFICTLEDIQALISSFNAFVSAYNSHAHGVLLTGPTTGNTTGNTLPATSASSATGTSVLKGQ